MIVQASLAALKIPIVLSVVCRAWNVAFDQDPMGRQMAFFDQPVHDCARNNGAALWRLCSIFAGTLHLSRCIMAQGAVFNGRLRSLEAALSQFLLCHSGLLR